MELGQRDIDTCVLYFLKWFGPELGFLPLQPDYSEAILSIRCAANAVFALLSSACEPHANRLYVRSVSDRHKVSLLKCPNLLPVLALCLFLDPENPRGSNAVPPLLPTPVEVQAIYQRNTAEALYQLALFPSGRDAILAEASMMQALEEVAERGMTAEAREYAEAALMALSDKEIHASEGGGPKHIMLSYQVRLSSGQAGPSQSSLTLVCLRSGTLSP